MKKSIILLLEAPLPLILEKLLSDVPKRVIQDLSTLKVEEEVVYIYIPKGFDPSLLPIGGITMNCSPRYNYELGNGSKVIVEDIERGFTPSDAKSPFDLIFMCNMDEFFKGRATGVSTLYAFSELERMISSKEKLLLLVDQETRDARIEASILLVELSQKIQPFLNIVMENYTSIKRNMTLLLSDTKGEISFINGGKGKTTYNPIFALPIISDLSFRLPTAYVINLKERTDRKARIIQRLEDHEIPYKIIEAFPKDSEVVTHLAWNSSHLNNLGHYNKMAEFACLSSHLKAIRVFVEDGEEIGLILEDDAVFHKRFDVMFRGLLAKLPPSSKPRNPNEEQPKKVWSLISLLVSNIEFYEDWKKAKDWNEKIPSLIPLDPGRAWGAVAYLISRPYASEILNLLDKPYYLCPGLPVDKERVTSEMITMYSKGLATSIPLVVEELSPSNINPGNPQFHRHLFSPLGFENYESLYKG